MSLQILRMAEVVKNQGGVYFASSIKGEDSRAILVPEFTELFWDSYEKNQILCFAPSPGETQYLTEDVLDEFPSVDAPFNIFSIEVLGSRICVNESDRVDIICMMVRDYPAVLGGLIVFVLYELDGQAFVFAEFCYNQTSRLSITKEVDVARMWSPSLQRNIHCVAKNSYVEITQRFIQRMNSERSGLQRVNERVKRRNASGENVIHKVRRVIHIAPERVIKNYSTENKLNLDFSHRWFVRGHWMYFWLDESKGLVDQTKIGKNRAGEYVEVGRTWRSEHIKGPEDKPLIRKARVVTTGSSSSPTDP